MKISKVAIPWFREPEYDEFRKLFVDGDGLPETFHKWLHKADGLIDHLRRNGQTVVKAYLHIETFPEWCRSRSLDIDAAARRKFANEFAVRDDSQ